MPPTPPPTPNAIPAVETCLAANSSAVSALFAWMRATRARKRTSFPAAAKAAPSSYTQVRASCAWCPRALALLVGTCPSRCLYKIFLKCRSCVIVFTPHISSLLRIARGDQGIHLREVRGQGIPGMLGASRARFRFERARWPATPAHRQNMCACICNCLDAACFHQRKRDDTGPTRCC